MNSFKVYDKVKWHYPEGKNCPNLKSAKQHFSVVMEWLNCNKFLSQEGKELYELGIGSDFSITSSMLTDQGNKIMTERYSELLKNINYSKSPTKTVIENYLN